ncbi:MAG: response regulator [Alphaproteobacteria bacterium]|nr:response regulator [Alphaproteobacteria bacterium]
MGDQGYDFTKLSVLIVEDSVYMRKIVKMLLSGLGFRLVYEAEDGASALNLINTNPIDIVFLDWEMPILNGIEFVQTVRNAPDSMNPFVPIVMLSAHSEVKRIVQARDAGVNEFVVKPLSAQTLYTRLVSVIERPRPFVRTKSFFGPDRRRKMPESFFGTERRSDMLEQLKALGSMAMGQDEIDGVMAKG